MQQCPWEDTRAYVTWLSQKTGKSCHLPSEAEWEYAARAGTTTEYALPSPNGSDDIEGMANCADCGILWDSKQAAPVGQFPPNAWGLYDMHGNVFEWVEDCWHGSYDGAPTNGQAWLEGNRGDCSSKVARGGSWKYYKNFARAASRLGSSPDYRSNEFGFRVVCSSSVSQILVVLATSKNPYFEAMQAVKKVATTLPQHQYHVTVTYGSETTPDVTKAGLGQLQAIRSFIEQKPPGQSQRSAVILAPASSSPDELALLALLISDLNKKPNSCNHSRY
jgi:Sulfatase-modifying factor enzyme 1